MRRRAADGTEGYPPPDRETATRPRRPERQPQTEARGRRPAPALTHPPTRAGAAAARDDAHPRRGAGALGRTPSHRRPARLAPLTRDPATGRGLETKPGRPGRGFERGHRSSRRRPGRERASSEAVPRRQPADAGGFVSQSREHSSTSSATGATTAHPGRDRARSSDLISVGCRRGSAGSRGSAAERTLPRREQARARPSPRGGRGSQACRVAQRDERPLRPVRV